MKKTILSLLITISAVSCELLWQEQEIPVNEEVTIAGDIVFIVNEGNFTWGNGSLSYYSYDSLKINNEVFSKVNGRALGDVPNSMTVYNDYAYIVVNNSGVIEIVKRNSMKSVETVTGLISPRNLAVIDNTKAYVTSLWSDSLIILDLKKFAVAGYINIRRTSESIIVRGKTAFVSQWYGGDEVMVIDTDNDSVIDSVKTGREPESMVIDKNLKLWVLCNGGWTREYFAELIRINTQTLEVEKRMTFPSILDSPSGLAINGVGDTLFYLEKGIRRLSIEAEELPSESFIESNGHMFYKFGVNPLNGDLFITDPLDYQQKGYVYIYSSNGDSLKSYRTGIIPGALCFMVHPGLITD